MIKTFKKRKPNSERWLLTYSDLITLLMIFFVIMYSMSTVDAAKYQQLKDSLNKTLVSDSTASAAEKVDSMETEESATDPAAKAQDLAKIAAEVKKMLKEKGLSGTVSVSIRDRGVVIELSEAALFDPGSIDIRPASIEMLNDIGHIVNEVNNYIRVEGNTDDIPMNSEKFKNNWDLSVMRASEVLQFLVSNCGIEPQKISAVGYGEYRPAVPNTSAENRAKNRRVDIVILSDIYNNSESLN